MRLFMSAMQVCMCFWIFYGCGTRYVQPDHVVVLPFPEARSPDARTDPEVSGETEAVMQYQSQMLTIQTGLTFHPNSNSDSGYGTWIQPTMGSLKQPIEWEDFYEKVGRPELASSYRFRSTLKWGFFLGGLVLGAASLVVLAPNAAPSNSCTIEDLKAGGCSPQGIKNIGWSISLGLGGMAAMIAGAVIQPQPVFLSEASRLAAEHNSQLLQKLKLRTTVGMDEQDIPPTPTISLLLQVYNQGGGLALGLRF